MRERKRTSERWKEIQISETVFVFKDFEGNKKKFMLTGFEQQDKISFNVPTTYWTARFREIEDLTGGGE